MESQTLKHVLPKSKKSRGFALIFVLVFVALVLAIVIDMMYQSQITVRNTLAQQQEIQAQAAARSGSEIARVLLTLHLAASQYQDNPYFSLPKKLYASLNGIPMGQEGFAQIESITGVALDRLIDPAILHAIETSVPGYFVLKISSENEKLNINLLQSTYAEQTRQALLRIFSAPYTYEILENNGYLPEDLINNLTSYIKISTTDGLNLDSITQPAYNAIGATYKPKHGALETLKELRRIPGFNIDLIYELFEPYLTMWPISGAPNGLNINAAPTDLIATLMTPTGNNIDELAWDKFDDYRETNLFNNNNIGSWFKENLQTFDQDKDADTFRQTFFGVQDNIFRVESRGVYQGVERTLVMIFSSGSGNSSNGSSSGGKSLILLHQEWVSY